MSSLIGSVFSATADTSADQTLAYTATSSVAANAQAYFAAALTATTPEVRRLFTDYCMQGLMSHEALMGLMIKKEWTKPYDRPNSQLEGIFQQSQQMMQQAQQ
ncbi:spore coat protein [Dendrosporobacter sp. 1207_IL3150]|uniref:spore coat protein n=1 Tax=Dendrosporobacter sp. 1207_IL3150 TaxID=3084054 RepID=UPI002FD9E09B